MAILYYHPTFRALRDKWEVFRDLYEGEHNVVNSAKYLFPHMIEETPGEVSKKLRANRETRTRYLNLPEIITSLQLSIFFKQCGTLNESAKKLLESKNAIQNADGRGTSFHKLLKDEYARCYLMYGKAIMLVDSFGGKVSTKAEEIATGQRPFFEVIEPLNAPDWERETGDPARLGQFNMLRHEYQLLEPRKDFLSEAPTMSLFSSVLYMKDGRYTVQRVKAPMTYDAVLGVWKFNEGAQLGSWLEDGDPKVTDLEEIPISVLESDSWIKDVCEESIRYHNLRSNKDNIQYQQGYQKLWLTGLPSNGLTPDQIKNLSEYLIGQIPGEGSGITAIDPVDVSSYERALEDSMNSIFKQGLNILRTLPSDSRVAQSGDSKDSENDNNYSLIKSTLEEIENAVNKSLKQFGTFCGIKDFDGEISLNKDIDEGSLTDLVTIYQAFGNRWQGLSKIEKAFAKEALRRSGLPETEELLEEIDNAPDKIQITVANDPIRKALGNGEPPTTTA